VHVLVRVDGIKQGEIKPLIAQWDLRKVRACMLGQ